MKKVTRLLVLGIFFVGMSSSSLCQQPIIPPYHEGFEPPVFTPGDFLSANGWFVSSGSAAIVVEPVHTGQQALAMAPSAQVECVLAAISVSEVWVEGYWQTEPNHSIVFPQDLPPSAAVLVFHATGQVIALDGNGQGDGTWVAYDLPLGLSKPPFARVSLRLDFIHQNWDVYVERTKLNAMPLGFHDHAVNALTGFESRSSSAGGAVLDDFYAGGVPPPGLFETPSVTPVFSPTSTPSTTETPTPSVTPSPIVTPRFPDFNHDGKINQADLLLFLEAWHTTSSEPDRR